MARSCLRNPTADYMRGFELEPCAPARRRSASIAIDADPARSPFPDGRDRAGLKAGQTFSRRHRATASPPIPGFARRLPRAVLARRGTPLACRWTLDRRCAGTDRRGGRGVSARVLVTGGSGFIGSALVKALVRDGYAVRVLDDNSRGDPRRLTEVEKDIEFVGGDIRDADHGRAPPRAAWTKCIISPSSTARNSSTARPSSCSMSASRA